jgi:hypothetical protein
MATLRIRLVLNEGRIGIPLQNLAGIATDTEAFLSMFAADLDLADGSVVFDCERVALDSMGDRTAAPRTGLSSPATADPDASRASGTLWTPY